MLLVLMISGGSVMFVEACEKCLSNIWGLDKTDRSIREHGPPRDLPFGDGVSLRCVAVINSILVAHRVCEIVSAARY